jgi:hypothetical protein
MIYNDYSNLWIKLAHKKYLAFYFFYNMKHTLSQLKYSCNFMASIIYIKYSILTFHRVRFYCCSIKDILLTGRH